MTAAIDLPTDALDYPLPEHLIAVTPADPRDAARLMVHDPRSGRTEHRLVRDLPEYLEAADHLVVNDSAVRPARLVGRRRDTSGRIEGLVLGEAGPDSAEVMLKSNGRLRAGQVIDLLDHADAPGGVSLLLRAKSEDGVWTAGVEVESPTGTDHFAGVGRTPLPPYILRARTSEIADELDRQWYQTVYADPARRGSVAAPTAGLHFTTSLQDRLAAAGVGWACVTLHVGAGTFKPIATEDVASHPMHVEQYDVPPATLDLLRRRRDGADIRTVAVGTTVVRTLESLPVPLPETLPEMGGLVGATRLLITPPYAFRHVDAMLTNFHLPRSTLLALVAAFVGLETMHALYREAIERAYRFYSYGDAMLLLSPRDPAS